MEQPTWSLSDDNRLLRLDVPSQPSPSRFELDAAGVEQMLRILIEGRMQMVPAIPQEDPPVDAAFLSALHMRWAPGLDIEGRMTICIMHPGIGWIAMPLSPEQWRHFHDAMAAFAARIAAPQPDRAPN